MDWNILATRMVRAIKLDDTLFNEVKSDRSATLQAAFVVVITSIAAGVGTVHQAGMGGIIYGTFISLAAWYVWAYIVYFVGLKLFSNTKSAPSELLRTIGFSSAPGIFRLLGFLPVLGPLIVLVSSVWMIVAMIKAVKAAFNYENTMRALKVVLIGWVIQVIFILIAFAIVGVY